MNKLKMFMLIILSIIVQTAIVPNFSIFGAYANVTLAFVVALSMNFGSYVGGYLGLLLGFISDLLFSEVIGVNTLIFYSIGFLVGYNEDVINKEDLRTGSVIIAILTFVYWILNIVIYRILGNQYTFNYLKFSILIEVILNVLLYIVCHYLLKIVIKKRKFKF